MKLNRILLLQATCSIILITTTYATSIESNIQRQAEVNLQQAPAKPLKFGEKTTLIQPQKKVNLPATLPNNRNNGNISIAKERQQQTRNRPHSRIERITSSSSSSSSSSTSSSSSSSSLLPVQNSNPQISRRYDSSGGSPKNQLVVQQHEIPIVHKNRDLYNKPITPTVGQSQRQQQQQRQQNSNRSRFSNTIVQNQQHTQNFPTNYQSTAVVKTAIPAAPTNYQLIAVAKTAIATEPTIPNNQQQQRNQSTATRTIPSAINNHPPLSSRNSNHNRTNNNSSIVIHHRSNSKNINNNSNISNNSQPLLTAVAAASAAGVSQPKNVTSSNKQRSNINVNNNNNVYTGSSTSRSRSSSIRSNPRKAPTSTASTTTTSSSTITTSRPLFQLPNTFNIFTPEFWQFLNPTTSSPAVKVATPTTTRKPPKKYKPAVPISTKEEKLNYSKPKTTTTTIAPKIYKEPEPVKDNTPPKRDDGPFRIALPTFNILSPRRDATGESEKGKRDVEDENLRNRFNCPRESEVRFQLFPKICTIDEDCKVWKRDEICCEIFGAKSCVSGLPKPLEETSHSPILGIQRKCPSRPLAELWWEVKECETDMDCWPRVCCPDGRRRYCRTSQPELNAVPVPVKRSFNYLTEYLECTAPPPPIFDLHPKACTSTLDCFPNVCCQEAGLRHCRPPKKSVLTMLASVFNVDFVKRLTQNIVIK